MAFEGPEQKLFEAHLDKDASTFMAQYALDPSVLGPPRDNYIVYVTRGEDTSTLPDYLKRLPPDEDELELGDRTYDVQVRHRGDTTFYFMFDGSAIETFEQVLIGVLAAVVMVVIMSALWLSFIMGNRIISPLTALSNRVARLDVTRPESIDLDRDADPQDEITVLASAINGYHTRISELLRREHEFSSDVSHELRTPLMAIQGAAENLGRCVGDEKHAGELISRIKRGCLQMTTLIEALLFLARDPSSFEDMIEPIGLDKVVNDQIAAVREVTDKKGITVKLERETDKTINAIPAVINIVIGNILKNAVKYTNKDVIRVFVKPDEVVIQDYGPGIDQAAHATLFDRFERGRNRNPDGTGIGLALVRRFCDQYGWTIDFRSEEGKGTRVSVVF